MCLSVIIPGQGHCVSRIASKGVTMSTAVYAVEGPDCDSCVAAVVANVHSLAGVTVVAMDLVRGGRSPLIVTSGLKLGDDAVHDAVAHVGFGVRSPSGRDVRGRGDSPSIRDGVSDLDRLQVVSPLEGVSS